jgi:transcriptional adapter 2-alpha
MNHDDFEEFNKGLIEELNLRQAIAQLQEWREKKITNLKDGEKYEQDKALRVQKAQPMGSLDRERFASSQRSKIAPLIETPSGAAALVAPELPIRLLQSEDHPTASPGRSDKILTNGHANGTLTPQQKREKFAIQPLSGVSPLPMTQENTADVHLLTPEEIELCEKTRINPKPYLVMKEAILKEALKGNGQLKKKQAKEICRVEGQAAGLVWVTYLLMDGVMCGGGSATILQL